jgi:hypothetical protein
MQRSLFYSSGCASLLFYAPSRARFVQAILFHARLSPFRLPVTTGAAEAVSTSSDMRCLLHVSCFAR